MDALSPYELSRAEQIRKNNAYLLSLGLVSDAKALKAKPKPNHTFAIKYPDRAGAQPGV